MDGLTASRIAGGNTAYSRNKQDLYPTPPEVTYALLDFLALPCGTRIWEPACGNGDMVRDLPFRGVHPALQIYWKAVCTATEKPVLARAETAKAVSVHAAGVGSAADMEAGFPVQSKRKGRPLDGRAVVCLESREAQLRDALPAATKARYGREHINGTSKILRFA